MKKIYALIMGSFIAFAAIAADRQPVVTINANDNYDIRIDGRFYTNSGNIALSQGHHEVEVYKVKKTFLGKRRILVSKNSFNLRNNDVQIYVDQNGESRIRESRNSNDRQDKGFGNDKKYKDKELKSNNGDRGRGHKYGHYKNKKQGKYNEYDDDDR